MRMPTWSRTSVVVPTYNRSESIVAAVRSAREQTLRPVEIIVVDDASTDNTEAVIRSLADSEHSVPIVYLRHTENRGGGAARNTGVNAAQGHVIAFLDSDDVWRSDKLERQCDALMRSEHPASTVVYSRVSVMKCGREDTLPEHGKRAGTPVGDYLFLEGGLMQTSTLLLPRELALAAPIDPDLRRHQDIFLCMELERLGADFEFVDATLTTWDIAPAAHRISLNPRVEPSLVWLERYGEWLGEAARRSFEARVLAPLFGQSGRYGDALSVLWKALRDGTVGPAEALELGARTFVPIGLQRLFRVWCDRLAMGRLPGSTEGR